MDFRFSQEHEMFRATVARFAREELAKHVSTMEETDRFPVEVFRKLGEMGVADQRLQDVRLQRSVLRSHHPGGLDGP